MKAFKGCINTDCKAYKKIHYKKNDEFCLKCGNQLAFVCADCWKPMESGKEKYCTSCAALKEQKRAATLEAVKKAGGAVVGAVGAVAVGVSQVAKNAESISKGAKKIAGAAKDVIEVVKK